MDIVGKRIKELRKAKNISVDELAEKIGKSRATIYRYENGEIENAPYTVLIPLAKALGTTPTFLMGYDEPTDCHQNELIISNDDTTELISLFSQLSEEQKIAIIALIKSMLEK